jgi:hypothetical protein
MLYNRKKKKTKSCILLVYINVEQNHYQTTFKVGMKWVVILDYDMHEYIDDL